MSSEEKRPDADSFVLTLEFVAGASDRIALQNGLKEIPRTSFIIAPKPAGEGGFKGAHLALSALSPTEIVQTSLTIGSFLGNLLPLAKLLLSLLKRKNKDEIIIKTRRGAVTIRSDMPVEVVVDLLKHEARIVPRKDAKQLIAQEKIKQQLREVKERKTFVKNAVKAYERLVETFTEGPPLTEKWQHDKLREYEKTLARYRRELTALERKEKELRESPLAQ